MTPITATEFAARMAGCGPWDEQRQIGVAVSGGADSLALAWLAKAWGEPTGFVVDHGLRAASAAEAAWTVATLRCWGMPAHLLRLEGLRPGAALAERARAARHAALEQACAAAGLVDLLYGHHARDQAETVLMRRDRGSGPAGLAGMAAVAEGDLVRRVRPLLGAAPGRLRATLDAAGLGWVEDPSNADARAARTVARWRIGDAFGTLAAEAALAAAARARQDRAAAAELAERATIYPMGYALLSPGPIGAAALAALLRTVSGARYPVGGVAALARSPRAATLGGARLLPGGRHGAGWLVVREERGVAPPVPLVTGAVWDGRFRAIAGSPGCELGKLGDAAAAFRSGTGLPSAVLRTLPAIRCNGILCHVPHLAYDMPGWDVPGGIVRSASLPAACAPFLA